MQKIILLFACFPISVLCFSQADPSYTPVSKSYYFDWGKDSTEIIVTRYGSRNGLVMVHLHDDEISSAEAAKKTLVQSGGILIELENNGKRLVSFKKGGKKFDFDPNRIFTAKGRSQNLHYLNDTVTPAAIASVKAFSAFILQKIPKSVVTLVAVHNNKNGKYSINSYKPGTSKDVLKWYKNPKRDPDNFFIVNNNEMFKGIKKREFNAVLQNSKRATDDGSLSIYYGNKHLVYATIETQKGNTDEQVKMLNALFSILR